MLDKYKEKLQEQKDKLSSIKVRRELKADEIDKTLEEFNKASEKFTELSQVKEILNKASEICRLRAIAVMVNTVDPMLKAVAGPQYSFKIEHTILRGKPAVNFWIVSDVDGEESLQDPISFCGGGFVDVISTALRFAFVSLYDGGINNAIILDEPGRMVSEEASSQFADFIKYFGDTFNKQIIMCTHSSVMSAFADRTIEVNKVSDKSEITIR